MTRWFGWGTYIAEKVQVPIWNWWELIRFVLTIECPLLNEFKIHIFKEEALQVRVADERVYGDWVDQIIINAKYGIIFNSLWGVAG